MMSLSDSFENQTKELKPYFECHFCDTEISIRYELHCLKKHNIYLCAQCEFFSDARKNLHRHKVSEHGSLPTLCCEICKFTDEKAINITKHIENERNNKIEGSFEVPSG